MASAITKKGQQQQQESIYDQLNKRVKSLLSEEITSVSPFAKELYKKVRNQVKKLDDIKAIEEKMKQGNAKIDEAQQEKLRNKDSFIQSVQLSLETFDIYKKTELSQRLADAEAALAKAAEPTPVVGAAEVEKEEVVVQSETVSTNTPALHGQENKVVECQILQTPPKTEAK